MKQLLLYLFLTAICTSAFPQKNELFVRVYDLKGKKFDKGFVLAANDTVLRIENDSTYRDIPVKTIGIIRTKRSEGSNALIGATIGALLIGGLGAASAEPDAMIMDYTAAEGAVIGMLIGAPAGAAIGLVTAGLKNARKFVINGDVEKWKAFREHLKANGRRGV